VLHTFKWYSLKLALNLLPRCGRKALGQHGKIPRIEVIVVIMVTLMSIFTNIAYAVVAGIAVCAMAFSWNAGQELDVHASEHEGKKIYRINGPIFFTSANRLRKILAPENDNTDMVEVWFGFASLMDYTAIATLHQIATDFKAAGKNISFMSLNLSSQKIIEKANDLVQSIEFTPMEPMTIPLVPGISDGYVQHPAAAGAPASRQGQPAQHQSDVTILVEQADCHNVLVEQVQAADINTDIGSDTSTDIRADTSTDISADTSTAISADTGTGITTSALASAPASAPTSVPTAVEEFDVTNPMSQSDVTIHM
jgi:hypothetical protein